MIEQRMMMRFLNRWYIDQRVDFNAFKWIFGHDIKNQLKYKTVKPKVIKQISEVNYNENIETNEGEQNSQIYLTDNAPIDDLEMYQILFYL